MQAACSLLTESIRECMEEALVKHQETVKTFHFANYKDQTADAPWERMNSLPQRIQEVGKKIVSAKRFGYCSAALLGLVIVTKFALPVAIIVGAIALKVLYNCRKEEAIIQEIVRHIDRIANKVLQCDPSSKEVVDFFTQYGKYITHLEYPNTYVIGVDVKTMFKWMQTKFSENNNNKRFFQLCNCTVKRLENGSFIPSNFLALLFGAVNQFHHLYKQRMEEMLTFKQKGEWETKGKEHTESIKKLVTHDLKEIIAMCQLVPLDALTVVRIKDVARIMRACPQLVELDSDPIAEQTRKANSLEEVEEFFIQRFTPLKLNVGS